MKTKIFLSSVLTIALCLSLIVGSTFALFETKQEVNIAVTAGKVDVEAYILNGTEYFKPDFKNGGTATINGVNELQINKMTPGDSVTFTIQVANNSNVKIAYKVSAETSGVEEKTNLMGALKCTAAINGTTYVLHGDDKAISMDKHVVVDAPETNGEIITNIVVTVEFPDDYGVDFDYNKFQEAVAKITFKVEAVQGNNGVNNNG